MLSTISKDQAHDHLKTLKVPRCLRPRVPRELVDVVAKPLPIIFEKTQPSGEVPGDWKKGSFVPILKKGRREDLGCHNPQYQHGMGDEQIKSSPCKKDLGLLVDARLNVSHQ